MQQSYEHLKSMLWASPASRVYAYVHGGIVPKLHGQLAQADVRGWDCLWRGALNPAQKEQAPYIVELLPQSVFTDWLLREAATAYPGWGMLGVSSEAMLAMREHGRRLMTVTLPDGQQRQWTWYDPALWGDLLPRLSPDQLDQAFGRLSDWVLVSPTEWRWLTLSAGRLSDSVRQCLPGAKA